MFFGEIPYILKMRNPGLYGYLQLETKNGTRVDAPIIWEIDSGDCMAKKNGRDDRTGLVRFS